MTYIEKFRQDHRTIRRKKMSDILYVCDQTKCENCSAPDLCRHTTDITHAKNFSYDGVVDVWYEDPEKTANGGDS